MVTARSVAGLMASEYNRLPTQPAASVAAAVNTKLPRTVGVPDNRPALSSVSPAGNAPLETAKLNGGTPPVAKMVWLYATPTTPVASEAGDTLMLPQLTLSEYDRKPAHPALSNAATVKFTVPVVSGTPEITPAVDRFIPAGKAPPNIEKLYAATPPLAESVWLNAVPATAAGSDAGDTLIGGQLFANTSVYVAFV